MSARQGEAYILTGQKTVQLERAENAVLLRIQMSHGAHGTGPASQARVFGVVSGTVVGDLLDLFELLDEAGLSNLHPRLVHPTVKQGYQRQRENAVKRMDAKHLVGPMVGRGKADEVGIFHVSESTLDVMLAAIAKDDFFVGQIGTIGKQNPFCRERVSLVSDRRRRRFQKQSPVACVCESPCPKENPRCTGRR